MAAWVEYSKRFGRRGEHGIYVGPGGLTPARARRPRAHVGNTAADENRRRRVAERALGTDDEEPGRSER